MAMLFLPFMQLVLLAAARRTSQGEHSLKTDEAAKDHCCCKKGLCEPGHNSTEEIYSPNDDLCCRFRGGPCGRLFSFSYFTADAPATGYCREVPHVVYTAPAVVQAPAPSALTPGHPAHTVQTYCDLGRGELTQDERSAESSQKLGAKSNIMQTMVNEITKNSIDTMAKEIFSIYLCSRWAPSSDFTQILEDEKAANQLPKEEPAALYKEGRFIPLRCSENFQVFEEQVRSLASWYEAEKDGAVAARLAKLRGAEFAEAAAFDIPTVVKALEGCEVNETLPWDLSVSEASGAQLLKNCRAGKWWLGKLSDWQRAMPFTSFMSPDEEAAKVAPQGKEQILMCFGKRVASQLHRREGGQHLMTDQNAIGCHGFWDLAQAGKMLDRIVKLWRPPTCQLASMELDMKVKIMELIANMNSRLFDALPALLTEELSGADFDGKALAASSLGSSLLRGVWDTITHSFSSMRGQYTRLGQLLGNTVVKWAVCPLKNISQTEDLQNLDSALGTEDDLARYYAEIAYAKWTGRTKLLPGEECTSNPSLPSTMACSIGIMQQDMPEPYRDDQFICPVRPFLPAKQQLEVFQKKKGFCPLSMSTVQMRNASWFFRGRTPQRKQYDMKENLPKKDIQGVRIMDFKSRQDTDFHVWRSFVTTSLQCTLEEAEETPRWCADPEVHYSQTSMNGLADGVGRAGRGAAQLVAHGMHQAGVGEQPVGNSAAGKTLARWLYRNGKGLQAWLKESTGKASQRYEKLRERSFQELEAGELVHSLSFQSELESTGADTKRKQRYDRYVVVAPCKTMDPETEFDLKYTTAEHALQLARKANQKFGSVDSSVLTVELVGSAVLKMGGVSNAWLDFHTLIRAGGAELGAFIETATPILEGLSGVLSANTGASLRAADLVGFQVQFRCGTRKAMHDLPARPEVEPEGPKFATCVAQGAAKNKELRQASPGAAYLREEVVVRVTFHSSGVCGKQLDLAKLGSSNETQNPVYQTFSGISGCSGVPAAVASSLPAEVKQEMEAANFRGLLLGSGLPDKTLYEVLVDPEEFLQEVPL